MHHFDQKGDVVNSQTPVELVRDQFQADEPGKIVPFAGILASWPGRPRASPKRWDLVKETVFALEEELGETGSWGRGSVVVSEAEGVRVAGC